MSKFDLLGNSTDLDLCKIEICRVIDKNHVSYYKASLKILQLEPGVSVRHQEANLS